MNEGMKNGHTRGNKSEGMRSATYECINGKDAREKIAIIGADCVVDVEVHYKEEVWWIVVFALIQGVHTSDVGAHEPSNCVILVI